jgi:hypothetical protein
MESFIVSILVIIGVSAQAATFKCGFGKESLGHVFANRIVKSDGGTGGVAFDKEGIDAQCLYENGNLLTCNFMWDECGNPAPQGCAAPVMFKASSTIKASSPYLKLNYSNEDHGDTYWVECRAK